MTWDRAFPQPGKKKKKQKKEKNVESRPGSGGRELALDPQISVVLRTVGCRKAVWGRICGEDGAAALFGLESRRHLCHLCPGGLHVWTTGHWALHPSPPRHRIRGNGTESEVSRTGRREKKSSFSRIPPQPLFLAANRRGRHLMQPVQRGAGHRAGRHLSPTNQTAQPSRSLRKVSPIMVLTHRASPLSSSISRTRMVNGDCRWALRYLLPLW